MSLVSARMRLRLLQPRDPAAQIVVAVVACSSRSPMAMAMSFGSSAPLTGKSQSPLLVLLADADRLVRRAVELLADLHLDQRALLLDHDDHVEAAREVHELPLRQRPWAGDLVEPQAHVVGLDLVEAELVHRLAHVEIGFADRDDADLRRAAAGEDDAVEVVGAHEGEHRVALVVLEPRLLIEDAVAGCGC